MPRSRPTNSFNLLQRVDTTTIINTLPVGAAILDTELHIITMNSALEALLGFTLEEAAGVPCQHIMRNNLCHKRCPALEAMAHQKREQAEGNIINKEREIVPVLVNASPLQDERGQVIGVLEIVEDLSLHDSAPSGAPIHQDFGELIGHCSAMERIKEVLPVIARADSSVLITGETGTGKDLVAAVIHRLSARAKGPFIKVNCGALPETLLESELFGHVRGAFTGADRDKPGRFQLADNGTAYLTEIGDLHLPLQVKLLTFLDDKEVTPVGGTKNVKTDVRIIAATHRNLALMVRERLFRQDLLYRLNVVTIDLPPLRDRGEDFRLLLGHFLKYFRKKFDKPIDGFSREALALLRGYSYPGNVRELRNIVEYAVSICTSPEIQPLHLPDYLYMYVAGEKRSKELRQSSGAKPAGDDQLFSMKKPEMGHDWKEIEYRLITEALIQCHGNRTKTANLLGWGRATLWRKMKKHGLI